MPSLHPAWRWGRVLLAPEAACRPFSPSLESQASSRPVTALTVAQPAPPGSLPLSLENAETPCHACPPAPAPSGLPSWSLQLPASVTLLSAWPLPLRLSRSHRAYPGSGCRSWRELRCPPLPAPPHPSRLSSSLPYVLDPGPSHGAPALAASSLCPSPAWAPGWSHPPALGSSLPASLLRSPGKVLLPSTLGLRTPALPQALSCSGGQGQPCRVHQIHTVTCSRTRVQGLEFPLFLLPSFPPLSPPSSTLALSRQLTNVCSFHPLAQFSGSKVWLWSLSPVFLSGFLSHVCPVQALALTPPPCQDHLCPSRGQIPRPVVINGSLGCIWPMRGLYFLLVVPAAAGLWPPL